MKVIILTLLIVVLTVVAWGPPTVNAVPDTDFNWKTYVNPQYGFSIKYPDRYDISFSADPKGDELYIMSNSYSDHFWNIGLIINPIDYSQYSDLKGFADMWYNKSIAEFGNQPLEPINGNDITNYPTYTYSTYIEAGEDHPGKLRIFKVALQIHGENTYLFSLSDLNTDAHIEEFDKMVNSFKIFS